MLQKARVKESIELFNNKTHFGKSKNNKESKLLNNIKLLNIDNRTKSILF